VTPLPENEDALNIFFVVQTQFIIGMSGPVDINHMAIHAAMDIYGVRDRRDCFEKVRRLARWWIGKIGEKNG
jgi:hypothetical protein